MNVKAKNKEAIALEMETMGKSETPLRITGTFQDDTNPIRDINTFILWRFFFKDSNDLNRELKFLAADSDRLEGFKELCESIGRGTTVVEYKELPGRKLLRIVDGANEINIIEVTETTDIHFVFGPDNETSKRVIVAREKFIEKLTKILQE